MRIKSVIKYLIVIIFALATPLSAQETPATPPSISLYLSYDPMLESAGSMIEEADEIEEELEDSLYRKIGDWRIYSVSDSQGWVSCYGQLNDPTLPIRIVSAQNIWGIAFADETDTQVKGRIIIDSDAKTFNAIPTNDGWAIIEVSKKEFQKLKKAQNLSLIPENFGEISYHLSSFSIPISIVETCVKHKGKIVTTELLKPKTLTNNPIGGGPAQYGGFNIVGKGKSKEYRYAISKKWKIYSALYKDQFAYCVGAFNFAGGGKVRLGYDNAQWQIALPVNNKKNWEGFLQIDGTVRSASGTAAGNWTIVWLGLPDLDKIRRGNNAKLGYGRADYDYPLSGSASAIKKIKECVERAGIAPTKK